MRKLHGFTMIEVVTVIAIAGFLAIMAFPRFIDRFVFERQGFYDQVVSTLRYAQKAAIAQRRFVCVAFTANSITLSYDATPPGMTYTSATCPGLALAGPGGQSSYTVSSSSAAFVVTPAAFYFDALGRPSVGSRQTISIASVTSPIHVEAETGYVH